MLENSDPWDVAPPLPSLVRTIEDVYRKLEDIHNHNIAPRNMYNDVIVSSAATSIKSIKIPKIFDVIIFTTSPSNAGNVFVAGPNTDPTKGLILEPDERISFERVRGEFNLYFTNASDTISWVGFSLE